MTDQEKREKVIKGLGCCMSIQVNDFRWEPGKNDAEYIKLLESSRNEWQKIAQRAIAKLVALSKAQEPKPPAVDAAPVVRCKNCWKRGLDNCPMEFYWDSHPADDNCYCAMGERREAGE